MELSIPFSSSLSESGRSEDEGSKLGPGLGEDAHVSVVEAALELDVLEIREGRKEKGAGGGRGGDGAGDDQSSELFLIGRLSDGLEEVGGVSEAEQKGREVSFEGTPWRKRGRGPYLLSSDQLGGILSANVERCW